MARIFITYRRREGGYAAELLKEKLRRRFGQESVFLDVHNIRLGNDFREVIETAVGQCDVLLVVIGNDWLELLKQRSNDPQDFVRSEIEAAIKREIPIVPILIEDARMPSATDLPESIREIVYQQAAEFRAGKDLRQHYIRIINELETLFESKIVAKKSTKKPAAKKPTIKAKLEAKPEKKQAVSAEKKPKTLTNVEKRARVLSEVQNIFAQFTDEQVYIGNAIPTEKLHTALEAYAPNVHAEDVQLLYDNTSFGGAKNGLILTDIGIYWHNLWEEGSELRYWQIRSVDYKPGVLSGVLYVNEKEIRLNLGDRDRFGELLTTFLRRVSDFNFYSS